MELKKYNINVCGVCPGPTKTEFFDKSCEGKYDLLATIGAADYYFKGDGENGKSANRIGYRVGAGAMYNFNDNISARVVGRYSYIGAKSLNYAAEVTAGLRYTF